MNILLSYFKKNWKPIASVMFLFGLFLFSIKVHAVDTRIWDGGGADANWSNPLNWSDDTVPVAGDAAIFNDTCVANCSATVDTDVAIGSIDLDSTYAGTITQGAFNIFLDSGSGGTGDFTIAGGTFNGGSGNLDFIEFNITGGIFNPPSGTWLVRGDLRIGDATINGIGKTVYVGDPLFLISWFVCATSANLNVNSATGLAVVINEGAHFRLENGIAGSSTCELTASVTNTGDVGSNGGILNLTGTAWVNSGQITSDQSISQSVDSVPAVINFSGSSINSDAVLIVGGSVFSASSATSVIIPAAVTIANASSQMLLPSATTFKIGHLDMDPGTTLVYGGSDLEVDGDYAVLGTFDISGKNLTLGMDYNDVYCTGDFNANTGVSKVYMAESTISPSYSNDQFVLEPGCELTVQSISAPDFDNSTDLSINGILNVLGNVNLGGSGVGGGTYINVQDGFNFSGSTWTSGPIDSYGTFDGSGAGTMNVYGYLGIRAGDFLAPTTLNVSHTPSDGDGDFYFEGTSFTAGSGTLNVQGEFEGGAGFDAGTGTVNFNGQDSIVAQKIYGDTAFYNFSKIISTMAPATLQFNKSNSQTISHKLILQGISGNVLSTSGYGVGSRWGVDVTGTAALCYANIADSNNTGSILSGYNLADGGNNVGWDFVSAASCDTGSPALTIAPSSLSSAGIVGNSYSQTLTASGVSGGTFVWSLASGSLPAGLSLNTSSSIATTAISGTPTTAGSYGFTIHVVNGSSSGDQAYSLTINNASAGGGGGGGGGGFIPLPIIQPITNTVEPHVVNNNVVPENNKSKPVTSVNKSSPESAELLPNVDKIVQSLSVPDDSETKISGLSHQPRESLGVLIAFLQYFPSWGLLFVLSAPLLILLQHPLGLFGFVERIFNFPDLRFVLVSWFYNLAGFFGLRRKRKLWGTVYDSQNKQPLDPAIVTLFDATTGKELDTRITDLAGRFGFLTHAGKFKLNAQKTHYKFPTTLLHTDNDSYYNHIYKGEVIAISGESDVVAPNIPMDPLAPDWNQEAKLKFIKFHPLRYKIAQQIYANVFWAGLLVNLLSYVYRPSWPALIFSLIYILLIPLEIKTKNTKLWGRVFYKESHLPAFDFILELTPKNIPDVIVGKAKTSADGKYFLKAYPGEYMLNLKNVDGSMVKSTSVTVNSQGLVDEFFEI